ncbi:PREDICTED: uncharacterized protein LOC104818801 isoform X2 [Tarenaya hassleriana]|uniref:uncharacterized protein LOC104818801 isoform X2 n=1 Tax=Tarenaya hassleriana TaxID=28532 RepID=UPI00053C4555|nr:PREDICTED: uncharacterized protein LOC104818801 isoform X2 [Tarenaya hassleriana]
MKRTAMDNAMRSGVVVLGSLAFGYLSLQLGFKPFLDRAEEFERSLQSPPQQQQLQGDEPEGWWEDSNKERWEQKR